MLKRTLQVLCDQIEQDGLQQQVEIVVSDNASTDNTREVVLEFIKKNTFEITYHRNEENLGVIRNILKLVELSNGRYWMFYGDDDLVPSGFLKQALLEFENNSNFTAFMFKWPEQHDVYCKALKMDEILTYERLAGEFFYYIGNAGIFAVETEKAKQAAEASARYLPNTCWPQTLIIFAALHLSENRTIKYKGLVASIPPEEAIVVNNGYYIFETTLYSLLRTALYIESVTNEFFVEKAVPSIYGMQHYGSVKERILERYRYFDTDKQKKDLEDSLISARRDVPKVYRREIDDLYRAVHRPALFVDIALYWRYFKRTNFADLNTGFINKIKILSPFGYAAMIRHRLTSYQKLKTKSAKTEVDASSGYF